MAIGTEAAAHLMPTVVTKVWPPNAMVCVVDVVVLVPETVWSCRKLLFRMSTTLVSRGTSP